MNFPRIGTYSSLRGDGSPLLNHPERIDALARWDRVVIDLGCMEAHPEIAQGLRAVNPAIELDGYVVLQAWNNPNGPPFFIKFWQIVQATGGMLMCTNGKPWSFSNVNVANRVTMDALAGLIQLYSEGWHGIFIDLLIPQLWSATQYGGEVLDWRAMGFASEQAFLDAWKLNAEAFVARLQGFGFPVTTNYGNGVPQSHGCMREDFPHQFGGTWESNMIQNNMEPGMLKLNFTDPESSWLCSAPLHATAGHLDKENQRRHRYGLASACLFGGFHSFGRYESDAQWCVDRLDWWFVEYQHPRRGKHWLGEATGPAEHVTEQKGKTVDLWQRRFQFGICVVNPSGVPHSIYFDHRYAPINSPAKTAFSIPAHDALIAEAV